MSRLLTTLFINLLLFHPAIAQTKVAAPESDSAKSQELAEAVRLSHQVVKLYGESKFDEAMPIAKRALEIRERALDQNNALVGEAAQNLAALYFAKKNYGEAQTLYKRALAILEKAHGVDSPKLTQTIDNMAWLYYASGDTDKAEASFKRALTIKEKAFGPDSREAGGSLYLLGQLYQRDGKYERAVEFYKLALVAKEKPLGPNHKEVADLLMKYSESLYQNEQVKEADEYEARALNILDNGKPVPPNSQGVVLQGKATYRAEPVYPELAKQAHMSGAVIIEVIVDENGRVIRARALSGPDLLARAALEAARKWRFTATTKDGEPVKVVGTITFNFRL